jgi:hypothetical protein
MVHTFTNQDNNDDETVWYSINPIDASETSSKGVMIKFTADDTVAIWKFLLRDVLVDLHPELLGGENLLHRRHFT